MATDFYQRQDRARRNTAWLVILFVIAVVCLVAVTFFVVLWASRAVGAGERRPTPAGTVSGRSELPDPYLLAIGGALGTLALVGLGTLFRVWQLRSGGGQGVAENVGGRRVYPNATEVADQRLLNVVEEMAIASGTPVPPVFLLDEDAINAFAAGYSPSDAVIGVTRGARDKLDREQLQGVIAHEFSHVLNGDMRMNIRMIGILHGILLLSLIGRMLFHMISFGGGSRGRKGGGGKAVLVLLAAGLALYLLGAIGSLFGGLIKAAVSRQREYLADASAVQFTRNPGGIAGALKRIGAAQRGSRLGNPNASEASHMYFAQGVFEGFTGLLATHPPLPKRIRAIDPLWDETFPTVERSETKDRSPDRGEFAGSQFAGGATQGQADRSRPASRRGVARTVPADAVQNLIASVGHPESLHRLYAAQLLSGIQPTIREAAHEPATARCLVIALLLDRDGAIREKQLRVVGDRLEPYAVKQSLQFWTQLREIDAEQRLPLVDLSLPALRSMTRGQYESFSAAVDALIRADQRVTVFEWTLARVLLRHLKPQFHPVQSHLTRYYGLQRLARPVSVVLSILARVGQSHESAARSLTAGAGRLPEVDATLVPEEECTLDALNEALAVLARASAPKRGELIDAGAAVICADREVAIQEAELLRGIADLLDCPIPPIVAATALQADADE